MTTEIDAKYFKITDILKKCIPFVKTDSQFEQFEILRKKQDIFASSKELEDLLNNIEKFYDDLIISHE